MIKKQKSKELRKLGRLELLELLAEQARVIEALEQKLAEQEKLLTERNMIIKKSGSIAEASLLLHDVFNAAQRAADEYVRQVQLLCDGQTFEQTPEDDAEHSAKQGASDCVL